MASFNVTERWGNWLKKQGFQVERNEADVNDKRPMRLFAPDGLRGKRAKKWFSKIFWVSHKRSPSGCGVSGCTDHSFIIGSYKD